MNNFVKEDKDLIWHPFSPLLDDHENIHIDKAEGIYLYSSDGRKIIDAISSWWVNTLGHARPEIASAIGNQARQLEQVIFSGFTHSPAIDLAKNLKSVLPENISKFFFSDNGSTAVEVALKLAIQYWFETGKPKNKIIALEGAYHGDTFGAMSVAARTLFNRPYESFLFDVTFIPFPEKGKEKETIQALKKEVETGEVAAFIFEPLVQGSGGMNIYSPAVLDQLLDICGNADVITICDEVFTGFYRTGKFFALDYLMNKPDLICLSKGITGGFIPLGITCCSKRIEKAFLNNDRKKMFFHGHSYTGNPLACAAANASFKILETSEIQIQVSMIEEEHKAFLNEISGLKGIKRAECLGTILAIEIESEEGYFDNRRGKIYSFFLQKNILIRPLGNVLYILPPYVIEKRELRVIYDSFKEFFKLYH